eukprot:TRINITY_DN69470_c0_g1_i1.p1 TRINITY_DN69470_c0_g1~~TRINITY_DN69470_c0_g1_i1.p1  ORF type:complete len:226 (-),score=12.12 TRINITY_DN69470_c0_g1_i1:243-845(-)
MARRTGPASIAVIPVLICVAIAVAAISPASVSARSSSKTGGSAAPVTRSAVQAELSKLAAVLVTMPDYESTGSKLKAGVYKIPSGYDIRNFANTTLLFPTDVAVKAVVPSRLNIFNPNGIYAACKLGAIRGIFTFAQLKAMGRKTVTTALGKTLVKATAKKSAVVAFATKAGGPKATVVATDIYSGPLFNVVGVDRVLLP